MTVVSRRAAAFVFIASFAASFCATGSVTSTEACRSIPDDRQRLACYDAAVDAAAAARSAASVDAERSTPPMASPPATASSPSPAPPAPPTAPPAPPHVVKKAAPEPPPPDTLNALVTAIAANPLGRLTVDLDNGERWAQTDTSPFVLHVGDRVNVKRMRFGSYVLEVVGSGRGMRVKLEASGT